MFWGSAGLRVALAEHGPVVMPYLETGAWLGATVGGGYTWLLGGASGHGGPHAFLGFTAPLLRGIPRLGDRCRQDRGGVHWRPTWNLSLAANVPRTTLHDFGLSLKCYDEHTFGSDPQLPGAR